MEVDVEIHCDGACHPNPGPGGWACIIVRGREEQELTGIEVNETTNNRMELQGVLAGLRAIKREERVRVFSDSNYVVQGIGDWSNGSPTKQGWMVRWRQTGWRKNSDLWIEIDGIVRKQKLIITQWVRGHSGNEYNERCDKLAVKSKKEAQRIVRESGGQTDQFGFRGK